MDENYELERELIMNDCHYSAERLRKSRESLKELRKSGLRLSFNDLLTDRIEIKPMVLNKTCQDNPESVLKSAYDHLVTRNNLIRAQIEELEVNRYKNNKKLRLQIDSLKQEFESNKKKYNSDIDNISKEFKDSHFQKKLDELLDEIPTRKYAIADLENQLKRLEKLKALQVAREKEKQIIIDQKKNTINELKRKIDI